MPCPGPVDDGYVNRLLAHIVVAVQWAVDFHVTVSAYAPALDRRAG